MREGTPLDRAALDAHPLPPVVDGDKESKGRLLIVAGSLELPGAAVLAATAAMRSGVGKVRIATDERIAAQVGIAVPEARVLALTSANVEEQAGRVHAVVAGPGMTAGAECAAIADVLLAADAKVAFDAAMLSHVQSGLRRATMPVLLPHAGELASMLGCDEAEIERDPVGCGTRAAELHASVVLVKGVTSRVVTPAGESWTYSGGAPGLGVSGSGDVLAGIVGGLLARGAEPLNALLWSVWLHGEAGARLDRRIGPIGYLAREIADEIPALLPR